MHGASRSINFDEDPTQPKSIKNFDLYPPPPGPEPSLAGKSGPPQSFFDKSTTAEVHKRERLSACNDCAKSDTQESHHTPAMIVLKATH